MPKSSIKNIKLIVWKLDSCVVFGCDLPRFVAIDRRFYLFFATYDGSVRNGFCGGLGHIVSQTYANLFQLIWFVLNLGAEVLVDWGELHKGYPNLNFQLGQFTVCN